MSALPQQPGPLGEQVEKYNRRPFTQNGYVRAISRFQDMQKELSIPGSAFRYYLSVAQYNSFRVLSEWWNGESQDSSLIVAAKSSIEQAKEEAETAGDGTAFVLANRSHAKLAQSVYHGKLFILFELEFLAEMRKLLQKDEDVFLLILQYQREQCAAHAAMQRIGYSVFLGKENQPDTSDDAQGVRHRRPRLPQLLESTMGACSEPCPWLQLRSNTGRPFYLWDVKAMCTILVDDLPNTPKYICVSHTWGRWPKEEGPTRIRGVPWLVPQNRRFEVTDLPDMLLMAFGDGYVWFDLLCIPQDRSERALLEISRQAVIFGKAISAVVWLNDVVSWKGLQAATEWLGLHYLQGSVSADYSGYGVPEPLECLTNGDEPMELFDWTTGEVARFYVDDPVPKTIAAPVSWFTSLWTLQEICLRPDMVMCNRDWVPLTVGLDTPITLDQLVALDDNVSQGVFSESTQVSEAQQANDPAYWREIPKPVNVRDLTTLIVDTTLMDLNAMAPAAVFTSGQFRHCTESRAEAIMSVVGATDWFLEYAKSVKNRSRNKEELVLELYPLPFIQEAAKKLGPSFPTSLHTDCRFLMPVVNLEQGRWQLLSSTPSPVGSLLPFTANPGYLHPPQRLSFAAIYHSSVESWEVQGDGSVRIPQVGKLQNLSAVEAPENVANSDMVYAPLLQRDGTLSHDCELAVSEGIDLLQWLSDFVNADSAPNYAVPLYQQTGFSQKVQGLHVGLLLKYVGMSGNTSQFVRIGLYFTKRWDLRNSASENVDWVVL